MTNSTIKNSPWYQPESIRRTRPKMAGTNPMDYFENGKHFLDIGIESITHPVFTDFTAKLTDQDILLIMDEADSTLHSNEVSSPYEHRKKIIRLGEISKSHPLLVWIFRQMIDRHGRFAIYKALESSGRVFFRDARFAADLGL